MGRLAEASVIWSQLSLALDPVAPPTEVKERLMSRVQGDAAHADLSRAKARRSPRSGRPGPNLRQWALPLVAAGAAAAITFLAIDLRTRGHLHTTETAIQVVTSPEVKVIVLKGPALSGRGQGRLFWDWHTGDCYLRATGLESAGEGRVYVLWFTDSDGEPVSAGSFVTSEDGTATLLTVLPQDIDLVAPVVITSETTSTVAVPSGKPLLSGELDL